MPYYESEDLQDTQELARQCAQVIQPGTLLLLKGPLGSGKTAFTQALGKALGIQRAVKSPTYTIIKEYDLPASERRLVHVDAYRLEDGGADTVDLEPYFDDRTICVIEWPQFIEEYLPNDYLEINFEPQGLDQRRLSLVLASGASPKHQELLEALDQHFSFKQN